MAATPEDTSFIIDLAVKALGWVALFLSGVITATWAVASKLHGFNSRLTSVEETKDSVRSLEDKIDELTFKLEETFEKKFDRVHARMDEYFISRPRNVRTKRPETDH